MGEVRYAEGMMENTDEILAIDTRQAGPEAQYMNRLNIIRMSQAGIKIREIAELLCVSPRHITNVRKAYRNGGLEALTIGKRGRKKGEKRRLTAEQESNAKKNILEKTPKDFGLNECLWTRESVREMLNREYNISLSIRTVGEYLKRWGLTYQRPVSHPRKQDDAEIKQWTDIEYPQICERAKAENAEILFADEANIQNTTTYMKGYAEKGNPPILKVESKSFKVNLIAAVSRQGRLRFMLYRDSMDSKKFILFLARLLSDRIQKGKFDKVFLIVDNLKVHHSKLVADWVKKRKEHIELFFLPAYAPEYNPDELLNSDLKRGVGGKFYPRSQIELESLTYQHLNKLWKTKDKILSFFEAPYTRYTGTPFL